MTRPAPIIAGTLAAIFLLFAVLGIYIWGYFWLSDVRPCGGVGGYDARVYPNEWLATLY